jgi:alkanesulfonate monooxygenase SsuD/methylene tetrahydromethanopterin reductase-like flavin-dependent oxidoreductase (luciferase family)
VTLPQFTDDASKFLDGARRAEEAGLDSIWVFDHMWPLTGGRERPVIECWTALGTLAVVTERIGIGSLVTRSSLRHPALIGKMAATVGEVAPRRLTVAIGSGDAASREENQAFGLPYFSGRMRYADLASTVEVVRRYLNEERFSHADEIVAIQDLPTSPRSAHPPPVWVAGRSKPILEIAGRLGDGWNGWGGTPEKFAADAARVRDAAGERSV